MRQVRFSPSPHFNARPDPAGIDMIVLHAISLPPGHFDPKPVEAFFLGKLDSESDSSLKELKDVRVSAHFVVDRTGHITQFVPVAERAWHAGVSSWQGREGCNDYAVGIEMIGDEAHPFTDAQYRETARLCRCLMHSYPAITAKRIIGHQDVAPGRKWDPGRQWEWSHFKRSLTRIRRLDLSFL